FTAFEKDVLRGEAAVVARAERELRERAVARVLGLARTQQRLELALAEVARRPVLALVGAHRGDVQLVVDDARERVAEERQRRRVLAMTIRGQQQARVSGGQQR